MSLHSSLNNFCENLDLDKTVWVAYSGGLDSHVLLHCLATLRHTHPLKLRAIHVNHSLSPHAEKWGEHCANICAALNVEFSQQTIQAQAAVGESPEEIARERRYAVLSQLLAPQDVLVTAQHQDDQAETVLLQMLRGAGPKGLSAMPRIKPLGLGFQVRPLLDFTRAELQAYAEENNLQWIEDESNTNLNFSRNYIRHEVMPVLKKRWPSVSQTLSRVSANCAEAQQFLQEISTEEMTRVQGSHSHSLSVKALLALDEAKQRMVLRFWLQQLGFPMPGVTKLQQIQHDMLTARADRNPHIIWCGVELRRYQDELYAMPCLSKRDTQQVFTWDFNMPLVLPSIGELSATTVNGQGLRMDLTDVTIRFRQGGEAFHQAKRQCHQMLKNLFQEWGVPTWQRDRIPLIYVGDTLAAVVGFGVAEEFSVKQDEQGYLVTLTAE